MGWITGALVLFFGMGGEEIVIDASSFSSCARQVSFLNVMIYIVNNVSKTVLCICLEHVVSLSLSCLLAW